MDKVYRLLDWLDLGQAVDWLQDLTKTQISDVTLLQLCGAGQCSAYLNCEALSVDLETGDDWPPTCNATGTGMSKVLKPLQFVDNSTHIDLAGSVVVNSTRARISDGCFSLAFSRNNPTPKFKPLDIEALAAKMNGGDERESTAEADDLRRKLALRDGEIIALNQKIQDINGNWKAQEADDALRAEKLYLDWKESGTALLPVSAAPALTFPYATKHLEAMQEAAIKYWAEHDRSKPAPYGIQKEVQNFLAERTGENSRKLAELAAAIKPDDLPKS